MVSQYRNPVLPGFFPDPSCVHVNGVFYLVNSTFQFFPGISIHVSTDLVSWTQVENAICRPDQLDLNNTKTHGIHTQGICAPTIRYHDGVFYVICTNCFSTDRIVCQNFIVTSKNPLSNDWSDPIFIDFDGIDPSLLFDDDGKVYFQGTQMSSDTVDTEFRMEIVQFEIDVTTGKSLSGPPKKLWDGVLGSNFPEGPHLYKKDGFYYLMIAEGGTERGHCETMARSLSPWGPFEGHPQNPILTNRGTDEYIQGVGHADMVQDDQGHWWALALATRVNGENFALGRETFLVPVGWEENEWPICNFGRPVTEFVQLNQQLPGAGKPSLGDNTATSPQLIEESSPQILYLRNPDMSSYKWLGDGRVALIGQRANLEEPSGTSTFLGYRQRHLFSQLTVTIDFDPSGTAEAGVSVYVDVNRHYNLSVKCGPDAGTRMVSFRSVSVRNGNRSGGTVSILAAGPLQLRIGTEETKYHFSYRSATDSKDNGWVTIETISAAPLSEWAFTAILVKIRKQFLLEKGADATIASREGRTVLKSASAGSAGTESMFNLRSLAAMVGMEGKKENRADASLVKNMKGESSGDYCSRNKGDIELYGTKKGLNGVDFIAIPTTPYGHLTLMPEVMITPVTRREGRRGGSTC